VPEEAAAELEMKKSFCFSVVSISFFLSRASFAIYGEYLPENELIPQTCKLTLDAVEVTRTPIELREYADQSRPMRVIKTGAPAIVSIDRDYFFCSSTLVAPHALASASHCFWRFFEERKAFEPTGAPVVDPENGISRTPGYQVERRIVGNARATCPGVNGKSESRSLLWENAWPHPHFAWDGPTFDTAIFRVRGEPFTIPPIPVAKNYYETVALLRNWATCRMFGYGHNNEGGSGVLHGARAYQFSKVSDYTILMQSGFNAVGSGDSGGTLVCKNSLGQDTLVGIVSMGDVQSKWDFYRRGDGASRFSPVGFGSNSRWVDTVVNRVPRDALHSGVNHDKGSPAPILNTYVAPFEFRFEIPGIRAELADCVSFYRSHHRGRERRQLFAGYDTVLKQADEAYVDITREYFAFKDGDPMIYYRILKLEKRTPAPGSAAEILSLTLGEGIATERKFHYWSHVRKRMNDLIAFLRTETNYCYNLGYSHTGTKRWPMAQARPWMQERLEKEVASVEAEWKGLGAPKRAAGDSQQ
jgi:hypothetical protein